MTRPRCYNRERAADGAWMRAGYRGVKPVLRWVPRWFRDRCATWDGVGIGGTPETQRYPQAHGWDCEGCAWFSNRVRALAYPDAP
jgi:hypothetical protein